MQAQHVLTNTQMAKQIAAMTRILSGDEIDLVQQTHRALADILQIADRGGDDVQGTSRLAAITHINLATALSAIVAGFEPATLHGSAKSCEPSYLVYSPPCCY